MSECNLKQYMSKFDKISTPEKELTIDELRKKVDQNTKRIAELGEWPPYIPPESLLERVPKEGQEDASGLDAGIASAIDLIPRDKQKLSAILHANYSKEAVEQVRKEFAEKNPDSQTYWWLAISSLCDEGSVDEKKFLEQIKKAKELAKDEKARQNVAEEEFEHITSAYELKNGVPYGEKDGAIQGAYIDGYSFGIQYSQQYGIYFIGTYEDSLGLEDFDWSDERDANDIPKSGPVHGSRQFVKCANKDELKRALEEVKKKLSLREDDKEVQYNF